MQEFFLPRLILASASPRRRDLLAQLGIPFEVVASAAEELHDESIKVTDLCKINAARKAAMVAEQFPHAVVLGADTLVALDNDIYGKPSSSAQAHQMLARLSGRTHEVITAVCLVSGDVSRQEIFATRTEVTFRKLDSAAISEYTRRVNVLDKAGAYAIQEHGEMIVENVTGSFSNVVGLPMEELEARLKNWGFLKS